MDEDKLIDEENMADESEEMDENEKKEFDVVRYVNKSSYRRRAMKAIGHNVKIPKEIAQDSDILQNHISNVLRDLKDKELVECLGAFGRCGTTHLDADYLQAVPADFGEHRLAQLLERLVVGGDVPLRHFEDYRRSVTVEVIIADIDVVAFVDEDDVGVAAVECRVALYLVLSCRCALALLCRKGGCEEEEEKNKKQRHNQAAYRICGWSIGQEVNSFVCSCHHLSHSLALTQALSHT